MSGLWQFPDWYITCHWNVTMNTILISKTNCKTSTKSSIRYLAFATGASLILLAGATSSCSTANGFGKDVEKTGDKIQDAATR